jgi:hypothetical protein
MGPACGVLLLSAHVVLLEIVSNAHDVSRLPALVITQPSGRPPFKPQRESRRSRCTSTGTTLMDGAVRTRYCSPARVSMRVRACVCVCVCVGVGVGVGVCACISTLGALILHTRSLTHPFTHAYAYAHDLILFYIFRAPDQQTTHQNVRSRERTISSATLS